jgi:predicted short-subunit dehydrogenase-like oxidoreductase (DUF2520 family)
VATRLGIALHEKGFTITHVYSPGGKSAAALAKKVKAKAVSDLKKIPRDVPFYLVAVKDDALVSLAEKLRVKGIVMHTSGTMPMDVLRSTSPFYGVLYPLQTLSKEKEIDTQNIVFCTEGSSPVVQFYIHLIAYDLSPHVVRMNSAQRKAAHLAAVFASNFSNHMFVLAQQLLAEAKLPEDILQPLIEETAHKLRTLPAAEAQTGPATRGDRNVMQQHIEGLRAHGPKDWAELYAQISAGIASAKKKRKK